MKAFNCIFLLASLPSCSTVSSDTEIVPDIIRNVSYNTGDVIDSMNGVNVYYNGLFSNVSGRNVSDGGYNIGLKYQCVEFVKRYYFTVYDHEMPNSWGHAKDFYNSEIEDGELNLERGLYQYENGGSTAPKVGDIIVFSQTHLNRYGHVAIVSNVSNEYIEIIQQNTPLSGSRTTIEVDGTRMLSPRVLGLLRLN
tara:strand:- start:1525 stop:2109 length:585 start_codon:yes stop_codon:yes gene_type:complete